MPLVRDPSDWGILLHKLINKLISKQFTPPTCQKLWETLAVIYNQSPQLPPPKLQLRSIRHTVELLPFFTEIGKRCEDNFSVYFWADGWMDGLIRAIDHRTDVHTIQYSSNRLWNLASSGAPIESRGYVILVWRIWQWAAIDPECERRTLS